MGIKYPGASSSLCSLEKDEMESLCEVEADLAVGALLEEESTNPSL